jgi:hypothetical protein
MDKETVVYLHNEMLFSHKKNKMSFVTTWIELEMILLSEITQGWKDKHHVSLLICGSLKS